MTTDYLGQMPEDFNPNESYGFNNYDARKNDWDFEAKENLNSDLFPDVSSSLIIKLIKQHAK